MAALESKVNVFADVPSFAVQHAGALNNTPLVLPRLRHANLRVTDEHPLAIVPSFKDFKERFRSLTDGVFDEFDWDHVVVAGGAVLRCLQPGEHEVCVLFVLLFVLAS
jgi:hypothetical protein